MALDNLRDLFVYELRDVYHAEKQLLEALPKMEEAASEPKLEKAFSDHQRETAEHVRRLERIFDELGTSKRARHCEAMEGLIEEARERIDDIPKGDLRDAALIVAAQKVEHYEIASYGSLLALANQLKVQKITEELKTTEEEEKKADLEFSKLATKQVNPEAAA
ncbi:MAG: ferritin-like domain-containing protein [Alphaproteobacteria bacterium]